MINFTNKTQPYSTASSTITFPPVVNLGHELAHAMFYDQNKGNGGIWYEYTLENGATGSTTHSEKFTTHMENKIRSEMGLELRRNYGPAKYGMVLDEHNRSYYYNSEGKTNFKTINTGTNRYTYQKNQKSK